LANVNDLEVFSTNSSLPLLKRSSIITSGTTGFKQNVAWKFFRRDQLKVEDRLATTTGVGRMKHSSSMEELRQIESQFDHSYLGHKMNVRKLSEHKIQTKKLQKMRSTSMPDTENKPFTS
jgi:hypothetical protein